MSFASKLPSVLRPPAPNSAISMERALKQIKNLLEYDSVEDSVEDALLASIDDIDVMLL